MLSNSKSDVVQWTMDIRVKLKLDSCVIGWSVLHAVSYNVVSMSWQETVATLVNNSGQYWSWCGPLFRRQGGRRSSGRGIHRSSWQDVSAWSLDETVLEANNEERSSRCTDDRLRCGQSRHRQWFDVPVGLTCLSEWKDVFLVEGQYYMFKARLPSFSPLNRVSCNAPIRAVVMYRPAQYRKFIVLFWCRFLL